MRWLDLASPSSREKALTMHRRQEQFCIGIPLCFEALPTVDDSWLYLRVALDTAGITLYQACLLLAWQGILA